MLRGIKGLLRDEKGLGVLEYQLLLASVGVAITVIMVALGMDKLINL